MSVIVFNLATSDAREVASVDTDSLEEKTGRGRRCLVFKFDERDERRSRADW